jgi:hypothetical protein
MGSPVHLQETSRLVNGFSGAAILPFVAWLESGEVREAGGRGRRKHRDGRGCYVRKERVRGTEPWRCHRASIKGQRGLLEGVCTQNRDKGENTF